MTVLELHGTDRLHLHKCKGICASAQDNFIVIRETHRGEAMLWAASNMMMNKKWTSL